MFLRSVFGFDEWREWRTIPAMEISDLTPAALTRLEEKLVRDLETVRRVKGLLLEMGAGVPEPVAAVEPVVAPAVPVKDIDTVVEETACGLGKPFRMRDLMGALPWSLDRVRLRSVVQRMVVRGVVRILRTDPGQTGSLYEYVAAAPGESPT